MIECTATGTAEGPAVEVKCTKMKDEEPFKDITAAMKRVSLSDGRSSLLVSHETTPRDLVGSAAKGHILAILKLEFEEKGATNKELFAAFSKANYGSKSKFDRGLRALKTSDEVRVAGTGKGARYFPVSVSVSSVSD